HNLSSSDVAFHALRDYVPGDDRRNIHWRTTARLGKLMVRQFEETQRSHLLIVLSLRTADYQNADEFETAVSSVASMAAQALRESREVSVFTHAGVLRFPSAVGLFDRLSGVDQVSTPTTFAELALAAITDVPHASVVALVTGGATSPQDLRAAHVRIPLQVKTFAVRCAADSVCARRRIANLVVLDVPAVEDLARSIRTVR
ncbi:MAG: DUF58 domain-containing protein, partial [Candidatus Phosphoribacter sp.]